MSSFLLTLWAIVLFVASFWSFRVVREAIAIDPYLSITSGLFGLLTFAGAWLFLAIAWLPL
jgi:hypothetical protein